MPDPLTNREIEDVLSSIRRLVSEAEQAEQEAPGGQKPELFLLTPALRVDPDPAPSGASGPAAGDAPETAPSAAEIPPFRHTTPHLLQEPLAAQDFRESEAEAISQAWETELGERPQAPSADERPAGEESESAEEGGSPDPGQKAAPRASAASAGEPSHPASLLEQRIAELEAAISLSHDEFEPDGSEPDAGRMPDVRIFGALGKVDPQERPATDPAGPTPASPAAALAPEEPRSGMGETAPGLTRALQPASTHKTARREPPLQLVGGRMSQLEDVGPEISRAGQAPAPEASAGTAPDNSAEAPEAEVLQADGEDIFVDEAVLRELIADVVREELQGTLGERITRNLRRMVHREVERALTLRKYD